MSSIRRSAVAAPCLGSVLVAGALLLGARPADAQETGAVAAPDSTPISVIFVVFPGETGAQRAMDNMAATQQDQVGHLESYAVVSRDAKGGLSVHKEQRKSGARASSPRAGKTIDGVVALLGKTAAPTPPERTAGRNEAGISSANAEKIQAMLTPGSSAIIFVVADPYVDGIDSAMHQAHAAQVLDAQVLPGP
jgi:uncharacterized membrane protein